MVLIFLVVVSVSVFIYNYVSCNKQTSMVPEHFDPNDLPTNAIGNNLTGSGNGQLRNDTGNRGDDIVNAAPVNLKPEDSPNTTMLGDEVTGVSSDGADFKEGTNGHEKWNNNTQWSASDLLPNRDSSSTEYNWDESNPQIKQIEGNAWLNERKFMGMYSVASSLRNATHDIRRDIPNPQMTVSPWNNSTILPDTNSKGLCSL
jgi:hypothetical protein